MDFIMNMNPRILFVVVITVISAVLVALHFLTKKKDERI
jgi:energy-coupling factor transporter transmembrane protein EcfT